MLSKVVDISFTADNTYISQRIYATGCLMTEMFMFMFLLKTLLTTCFSETRMDFLCCFMLQSDVWQFSLSWIFLHLVGFCRTDLPTSAALAARKVLFFKQSFLTFKCILAPSLMGQGANGDTATTQASVRRNVTQTDRRNSPQGSQKDARKKHAS